MPTKTTRSPIACAFLSNCRELLGRQISLIFRRTMPVFEATGRQISLIFRRTLPVFEDPRFAMVRLHKTRLHLRVRSNERGAGESPAAVHYV